MRPAFSKTWVPEKGNLSPGNSLLLHYRKTDSLLENQQFVFSDNPCCDFYYWSRSQTTGGSGILTCIPFYRKSYSHYGACLAVWPFTDIRSLFFEPYSYECKLLSSLPFRRPSGSRYSITTAASQRAQYSHGTFTFWTKLSRNQIQHR